MINLRVTCGAVVMYIYIYIYRVRANAKFQEEGDIQKTLETLAPISAKFYSNLSVDAKIALEMKRLSKPSKRDLQAKTESLVRFADSLGLALPPSLEPLSARR